MGIHADGWSPDAAYETVLRYLKGHPETDAILAVNDVFASGSLRACRELGLSVPQDISIIGAKNTILAESAHPTLTSIEYHFDELARIAARRMNELVESGRSVPVRSELIGALVERNSSRRPSG